LTERAGRIYSGGWHHVASCPIRGSLATLRKGEDLYVREDRMLGSIRSTKQCIACHGGERGVLLGAFSYTLRPASK